MQAGMSPPMSVRSSAVQDGAGGRKKRGMGWGLKAGALHT